MRLQPAGAHSTCRSPSRLPGALFAAVKVVLICTAVPGPGWLCCAVKVVWTMAWAAGGSLLEGVMERQSTGMHRWSWPGQWTGSFYKSSLFSTSLKIFPFNALDPEIFASSTLNSTLGNWSGNRSKGAFNARRWWVTFIT